MTLFIVLSFLLLTIYLYICFWSKNTLRSDSRNRACTWLQSGPSGIPNKVPTWENKPRLGCWHFLVVNSLMFELDIVMWNIMQANSHIFKDHKQLVSTTIFAPRWARGGTKWPQLQGRRLVPGALSVLVCKSTRRNTATRHRRPRLGDKRQRWKPGPEQNCGNPETLRRMSVFEHL